MTGITIDFYFDEDFETNSLKLLKRFNNLCHLEVITTGAEDISKLIQFLVNSKSFKCLEKIKFTGVINEKVLNQFGLKFGHRLKSMSINSGGVFSHKIKRDIFLSNNLEEINVDFNLKAILSPNCLPKLHTILNMRFDSVNDFTAFANLYCNQIKKLTLSQYLPVYKDVDKLYKQLSRFENLEDLNIFFMATNFAYNSTFGKELLIIKQKCKKLNQFHIHGLNLKIDLSVLTTFDDLNVLGLHYYGVGSDDILSIARMKNLTKLYLHSKPINPQNISQLISKSDNLNTIYCRKPLINETTIKAFVSKAVKNPSIGYKLINIFSANIRISNESIPKNLLIMRHNFDSDTDSDDE